MNKTLLALLLLGGGAITVSEIAQADSNTGQCEAIGGSKIYNLSTLPPDASESGSTQIPLRWKEPNGTFFGKCNCDPNPDMAESVLFTFQTGLTAISDDRVIIDAEHDIEATFRVHIGGNYPKPLADVSFNQPLDNLQARPDECYENGADFSSGSEGEITLYFKKPITENYHKSLSNVLKIYAKKESAINYSATPLAIVNLTINLTIPAQCQLEPGTINVNFGKLAAGDFAKGKGAGTQSVPLKVTCKNPEDVSKARITFTQNDFKDDLVATNDQNLGIKLAQGNTQLKSDSEIFLDNGETTIYATPTQSGDKKPAIGKFNATATLNVKMN
ncbi:TPA: fimbrial protein [Serratia odorifera]